MQSTDGRSLRERSLLAVLAAAAAVTVVAAAYSNALEGPFLWDDRPLILEKSEVKSVSAALAGFRSSFWNAANSNRMRGYYRPLTTLSYAVDRRIWGEEPEGFHATNVALHLINVVLVFALARRAGAGLSAAFLASVLWGSAPRLSECVTWISGRTDSLAALFVFLALFVWDGTRRSRRWAAMALFGAGLLSKEVAVALLPALLAFEFRSASGGLRERLATAARRVWPMVAVFAAFMIVRQAVLSHQTPTDTLGASRILIIFQSIAVFLEMVLDPLHPQTQIGRVMSPEPLVAAAGLGVVTLLIFTCIHRFRGWAPRIVAAAALALGSLLPVIHIVPIANNVIAADRFLYLPLAGLAIALAALASGFHRVVRRVLLVAAVAGLATFPFATNRRNEVWSHEMRFWALTIRETRWDNVYPRLEFGRVLFRTGRFQALVRALETLPFGSSDDRGTGAGIYELRPLYGDRATALDALLRYDGVLRVIDEWARGEPVAPAVLEGAYRLQRGDFEGARRIAEASAAGTGSGSIEIYRWLLKLVEANGLERVSRDVPDPALLAHRARLLRPIGGTMAEAAWSDVVFESRTPLFDRLEGLAYLYERGERKNLLRAIAAIRPLLRGAGDREELIERLAARDRDDVEVRDVLALIAERRPRRIVR
ncbi:MAG TPA: hypothetical protein VF316_06715 [Polyangiaceae bacterium]